MTGDGRRYSPRMSDSRYVVLSGLGPDRPGLVAAVTRFFADRGGNVEDSRMAILGGEFGVMVLVAATEGEIARMEAELPVLEQATGMRTLLRRTVSPEQHRKEAAMPVTIVASALDQEGIVRSIAGALHALGINVVSLETSAYPAAMSGHPLFRLEAHVDVPSGVAVAKVRQAMDEVAERFDLDVEVRAG